MFGSTSNTPFGTGSTFGTGTSLFGAGNTTTSGLFVLQQQTTKTFFAQLQTWGLFGAQTSSAGAPAFATGFGTGVYGQTSSGQTTQSGLFGGTSTSTGTGLFATQSSGFGQTQTGTGGLFGQTGFGLGQQQSTAFGKPFGGTFGTLGAQQTSLFGGNALGGNQNTALTTLQQQQQQKVLEQQLLILSNSPFGDSPLFRNSLLEKSKPERASTATTSSLQKVVTTPSHYKVSPRPAARIKPKPINNHTMNKSKLFEGLEEDSGLSPDTFVPRKNIKKLVLKTKSSKEEKSKPERASAATTSSLQKVVTTPSHYKNSPLSVVDTTRVKLSTLEGDVPDSVDTTISELRRRDEEGTSDKGLPIRQETHPQTLPDTTSRDNVGVVLKRWEYYTVPPVHVLNGQMDSNGDILVDDFVVGREGYGKIKFYGRTNVAGLNLDEIVFFRGREIEVYPDTYLNKPPVGEELNKKAEITLENIWPSDKTTREPIKSPERLNLLGWPKRVETATEKLGATFLDFNHHTGYWVFKVDHFTRYRMDDEFFDDEQA